MLDIILLVVIGLSIIIAPLVAWLWRKKYFVEELYLHEGRAIVLYVLICALTIIEVVVYFCVIKDTTWRFWLYILIIDWIALLVIMHSYTTCLYLQEDMLVKKDIFHTKKLQLTNDTVMFCNGGDTIYKSNRTRIVINGRYYAGDVFGFVYRVGNVLSAKKAAVQAEVVKVEKELTDIEAEKNSIDSQKLEK